MNKENRHRAQHGGVADAAVAHAAVHRGPEKLIVTLRFVSEGVETFLVRVLLPEAPPVTSECVAPDHIVFTSDCSGLLEPQQ